MAMARKPRGRLSVLLVFATVAMTCLALSGGTAVAAAGSHAGQRAGHHHHAMRDRDHDGMSNKWERMHHLNPRKPDAKADPDKDHLKNLGEFHLRTRPHASDTDSDGLGDGAEVHRFGTDPTCDDSDHDGIDDGSDDGDGDGVSDEGEDGDHAGFVGTIISFDPGTGHLLFESSLGWPVTALVTEKTDVLFTEGCTVEHPECFLAEGQGIDELHFASEPIHGVPVVRWIVLTCPEGD